MSGDYRAVEVMASCRCHATLKVHQDLLQPGRGEDLKKESIRQIDQEGDPGTMHSWEPESFCQRTELYLSDQELEIEEDDEG